MYDKWLPVTGTVIMLVTVAASFSVVTSAAVNATVNKQK